MTKTLRSITPQKQAVLDLVRKKPGLSIPEVAHLTKIPNTRVSQILFELQGTWQFVYSTKCDRRYCTFLWYSKVDEN